MHLRLVDAPAQTGFVRTHLILTVKKWADKYLEIRPVNTPLVYIKHFLGFADSTIPDLLRASHYASILHNNHVIKHEHSISLTVEKMRCYSVMIDT